MIVHVSKCKMNAKIYETVLKLLREFNSRTDLTGEEFVEEKLEADCNAVDDAVIEYFLLLVNHQQFLKVIKDNLISHYSIRNHNEEKIIMLLFFVIFICNNEKADEMLEIFKNIKCALRRNVLEYFREESNLITTALTGCKIFEDTYVLKYIIHPLINKQDLFKKFLELLDMETANRFVKKPITIPDNLNIFQRKKRIPAAPLNTPEELSNFQARKIPKSIYLGNPIEKKLIGEFEKNRIRAQKLLEQAKSLNTNFTNEKREIIQDEAPTPVFKAKKAPSKNNVEIRDNVATVLREANICIKEQEREIKQIEEILRGGADWKKYQELEENARKLEYQQHLDDVERKHLEGLLTFEEAILAKKRLLQSNKEKFRRFMDERQDFMTKLELWKERESEKIKQLVKKGQEIERKAKESEIKLKEERKTRVDRLKDEARKRRQALYEKQKDELEKKAKLIQEIKSLHQLKMSTVQNHKEQCEAPNFGLLCQMSIADLQQKLAELKVNMKRQLEQKRRCILLRKEKQKQMIKNVKNFIAQARMSKPKIVPNRPPKLARTSPDLDKLRSQLEYVRELRKSTA